MKLRLLAALAILPLPLSAQTALSPVRVRVEQISDVNVELHKKTQEKKLKIYLTNSGAADFDKLNVKYFFFGKAGDDSDLLIINEGALPAAVTSHGSTILETPAATANFVEAHYKKTYKAGVSARNTPKKKVSATGERITGYGVQVLSEGKVLTEFFSEASLKKALPMSALP